MLPYVLQRLDYFYGFLPAQLFHIKFMIIFMQEIPEVAIFPAQFLRKIFDVKLLPDGQACRIELVILAAHKVVHHLPEPVIIQVFGALYLGRLAKDIPVFFVA